VSWPSTQAHLLAASKRQLLAASNLDARLTRSDTIRHLLDVGLAHIDTPKTPNTPAQ
jgi:hypothetical protein